MHSFQVSRVIDEPVERVWDLVDDFANTYVYHPLVERSFSINGTKKGLGAARQCTMYGGASVQEKVVEHDAAARSYKVVVVDHGPFPLKHMEITISAAAVEGGTRLSFDGQFLPKFGPAGWLMAKAMMGPQFKRMLRQLAKGVETHLETGRVIGRGGKTEGPDAPLRRAAA